MVEQHWHLWHKKEKGKCFVIDISPLAINISEPCTLDISYTVCSFPSGYIAATDRKLKKISRRYDQKKKKLFANQLTGIRL